MKKNKIEKTNNVNSRISRSDSQDPDGQPITNPFTVIIDTREQAPYSFRLFKADAKDKGRPLYIPTSTATLKTGDYSILGHESEITVERKSLTDLYGTIGGGRDRFERELARMSEFRIAHVVVEADWFTALKDPPVRTQLSPKTIFRSINAWEQEFPTVHWQFMGIRALAEHKTFRILERFWKQKQKSAAEENQKENAEHDVTYTS